ncbi:MAG: substrate-binding domain-containing protein, partial [Caulobacteraceae bacterium]
PMTLRTRRRRAIALLALAGGVALAGCHRSRTSNELVVSLNKLSTPYSVMLKRYAERAARQAGVEVAVLDGQGDSSKQSADLRAASVRGAKAIVLAPNDSSALAPAVDDLRQDGVAVIAIDRRLDGTAQPVAFVGADNTQGGRLLGQWVVQHFPKGARVVVITNEPGSSTEIERSRGVHQGLGAGGPTYRIIAEQTANSSRDQALTVTQNILTAFSAAPPDAIICLNDDMAIGALEAIRSAGLPRDRIKVLGFDANPEALARIRAGDMSATVEQSPARQVSTAIREALDAIRTGAKPRSVTLQPLLITAANLDQAERASEAKP